MEPPNDAGVSSGAPIKVILEIDRRKYFMSDGIHILYNDKNRADRQSSLQNKPDVICVSSLSISPLVTPDPVNNNYANINPQAMLAMFSISKSSVSITKMDTKINIRLASKNLITFEPCELKNGDYLQISNLICCVYINKTSPTKMTNDVNSKFTCQTSNISPPMKYASPPKNCKIENVEHALNDLLNGETNNADSIYDMATQVDIHNVETQVETSPILKSKSIRRSLSKSRKFNGNASLVDEINDSEIICFDPLVENTVDNQESQNLLLDYNSSFTNDTVDSKRKSLTSKNTRKKKELEAALDDDSSTDVDEFEIHTELPKSVSTQSQNNHIKSSCNNTHNLNSKNVVDPYEVMTQIDPDYTITSKPAHNSWNNRNKEIMDNVLRLGKMKRNMALENDDLYDAPTQIMIPEKNVCLDINNLYEAQTQVLTQAIPYKTVRSDIDDLYEAQTQVLTQPIPYKTVRSNIDDLYEAPTQVLTQAIPGKTVRSDVMDLYDVPTQIITQEMAKKTVVANDRDTYRKTVLKNCLTQDLFNIECGGAMEKNRVETFHYIDKANTIDQKNMYDDDNPFYPCTQDIYNDLKSSQVSQSVVKVSPVKSVVKMSPVKSVEFAIPKILSPKKKSVQKIIPPNTPHTKPNYYGCTQDIENDLCSQIDSSSNHRSLNKFEWSNSINKPGGSKNSNSNDFISSSQDSISDSYLFPEEKEEEYRTPEKASSFSILDMQLPDTPELERSFKNTIVPDSSSASESENEITDSPPVAYKSKIPNKSKIKRKEPIKPSKSINRNESTKNNKMETRKKENKMNCSKDFELKSNEKKTVSSVCNNNSDRRKRRGEELIKDVQEKRPKISNSLRSSSRIQNDKHSPLQKIMVTGSLGAKHADIINKLGGEVVQKGGDVLVVEKFSRTFKLMMSISRGIPIVNTRWLIDSDRCSRLLDTKKYLINDREYEKKYSFKFENLWNTKREKFLKGWTVFITPSILPPPTEMDEIIKCNGGVCSYQDFPSNVKNNNLKNSFTISCNKDKNIFKNLPEPHLSVEAISVGVFTRTLDFQKHRLNV
ncbi:uncharacterized protein LOC143916074 [Arctopsyche grandis]|uniref:uncharacterized protein LOC143916074 n=1 Tax=Arctopsyche grandis TaxID=121162 RepID=UPI00406D6E77